MCMVSKTNVFSKIYRKPHRVPLMPKGDDVELGNQLTKKCCIAARKCVVFENGLGRAPRTLELSARDHLM